MLESSFDFQEFTASGTWTKPATAQFVLIEMWGAGGGGGSGRRAPHLAGAGSGGGGGSYLTKGFKASDLSSTVAITVGLGGTGGAAVTVDNTNGNAGANGGDTSFGSYAQAFGGQGGTGGTGTSALQGGRGAGTLSAGASGGYPADGVAADGTDRGFGGPRSLVASSGPPSVYGGGGAADATTTAQVRRAVALHWAVPAAGLAAAASTAHLELAAIQLADSAAADQLPWTVPVATGLSARVAAADPVVSSQRLDTLAATVALLPAAAEAVGATTDTTRARAATVELAWCASIHGE